MSTRTDSIIRDITTDVFGEQFLRNINMWPPLKRETAMVRCGICKTTPMRVDFLDGEIEDVFKVCKCPLPPYGRQARKAVVQ